MTSVRLSPFLAALTWIALGATMIVVAGLTIGIPSYADVLFGFLPDFDFPRGPLIGLELAFGLCIEGFLFVTGVLLGYLATDQMSRPSVLRWMNGLVGTAAAGSTLIFATLFFIPGPPQLYLAVAGSVVVSATVVLVLLVLRSLLRRAVIG